MNELNGLKVVVSAGGTREPLDPVRYLGNRSSGKQGLAIARAAAARGATVTLVAANVSLPTPDGVAVVPVETTIELQEAVVDAATDADVVVMAAAPADFRPATASDSKIKKGEDGAGLRLDLVENPDIVKGLVADRAERGATRPVIVSFAAETGDATGSVLDHARAKFSRKGSDLQVTNEVGYDKTFGQDENTVHILTRGSDAVRTVGPASKDVVADAVLDVVAALLHTAG
jgi:phosphopantothenoylcysteine decarboxylase/phosphopantothenate--cysteine ligase